MAEAQLSARKRDQTLLHMQWFGQRLRGWRWNAVFLDRFHSCCCLFTQSLTQMQHGDASISWGFFSFLLWNKELDIFELSFSRASKVDVSYFRSVFVREGKMEWAASQRVGVEIGVFLLSVHRHMQTLVLSLNTKYLSSWHANIGEDGGGKGEGTGRTRITGSLDLVYR